MNEQFIAHADKMAQQFGVRPELFRATISQESRWQEGAVSPKGAQGLGQVMPATGKSPGYGVKPLQDDSPEENLRFSAEYLSKMIKLTGSEELGLAAYNAGYGRVLEHGGVPPIKETQDYVSKIMGSLGETPKMLRPEKPSTKGLSPNQKALANREAVLSNPLLDMADQLQPLSDKELIHSSVVQRDAERVAKAQAGVPDFDEAMEDAVANYTLSGTIAQMFESGAQTDWQPSPEDKAEELRSGLVLFPEINATVQGFRNQEDYHRRLGIAKMQMDLAQRSGNATGWDAAKVFAGSMAGSMADPVAGVLSFGVGNAFNAVRVSRAVWAGSRLARSGAVIAEGALSNALVEAGLQAGMRTEMEGSMIIQQGLFGAVLSSAFTVPFQARRAFATAGGMAEFDRLTGELGGAIDAGAAPSVVSRLQANIDEVKSNMLRVAEADGDAIAAQVWAQAGPGSKSTDIAEAIKAIRQRKDAATMPRDPINEVETAPLIQEAAPEARKIGQLTEDGTPELVAGMRLSNEASAVRRFAYDLWQEDIDPALAGMQQRMRDFYKMREGKLGDYAGLAQWLDSPGLVVQTSGSRVARMLGAHLFESSTGLGARHQSAALNYEIIHSRLAHNHIPALKEALLAGLREVSPMAVVRHAFGGGRDAESSFWRAVAKERIAHRTAVQQKAAFVSSAPAAVQRAAGLLDKFWWEAAHTLKKAGVEEGDAIINGGVVGHTPYQWNHERISEALRNDPPAFNAFQSLLENEFRSKVLDKALEGLGDQGEAIMKKRVTDLQGDIAAVQDEIAKIEDTRRVVDNARGDAAAVADELSKLNELRKPLLEQEKALQAELKEAIKAEKAVAKEQAEAPTNFVKIPGTWTNAEPGTLQAEVGRSDMGALLSGLLDQPHAFLPEERVLADALLQTLDGQQQVIFARDLGVSPATGLPYTAYYDLAQDAIFIRWVADVTPEAGVIHRTMAGTLLHEMAHARTSRMIHLVESGKAMPPEVTAAVQQLGDVMQVLREKFPHLHEGNTQAAAQGKFFDAGAERGIAYAMKDKHELVAQVFNDATVRKALSEIKLDGERSLLSVIWEKVVQAFGLKDRSLQTEVLQAIDSLTGTHGVWTQGFGASKKFAPTRSSVEIKAQLDAVKASKAQIDAQRKAMQTSKQEAKARTTALKDASGTQKLDNLRLQLNNRKAALADIQRDPLGWWGKEVQKLQTAANAKASALTSSYLQQVIRDPESRMRGITLHAARLGEDLLKENWAGQKVDADLAEAFGTLLRERLADRSRTEFDLNASVKVGDREVSMLDFMDTDGLSQVKSSSHQYAGRAALAKMGLKDDVSIEAAMDAARTDGATPDELKALRFGFDFLNNTLNASDAPAMHALRNMTYFTRMGKLGMSIVADVPQMVSTLGTGLALKTWGRSWLQHSLNGESAYGKFGKPTPFAMQLAQVAPGALGRDHRLMTLTPDNPATGAADRMGASLLQRTTARGAQFVSWVSGANHVNMAMHRALLPVLAEEVLGAVSKKSAINAVRLADMGMSDVMIAKVKAQMDKYDAGRKPGDAINWNKWDDQLVADELIGVIHRGMYQTLQKSLLGESPQWLTDSSMGRLIGQFRRFGLTAAEKMTARQVIGFQDKEAVITAVMGITWASLLYYARVHVNAAGRENADEYIDQQLQPLAMARGVMTMWNMSGLAADFVSVGEAMFGSQARPITGTAPAAALGVVQDIGKAAAAVGGAVTGEKEAKDAVAAVTRLMPGANSVPLTYFLNELNKD